MTATGRLTQAPPGDALVVNVDALASGLTVPAHDTDGAIVVDPTLGGATAAFSPGTPTALHSLDNRVDVEIPANAFYQSLTFRHDFQPGAEHRTPSDIAGRKRGMGVFYLNATTAGGDEVHRFDAPLTMTVSYTPQQLQATGISEDDLTLFWYDESQFPYGNWVPAETNVDSTNHTVTASINHLSPWSLSDGSDPSAAFIPSLQGWQVGLYTGDVNYSYPIEVPAGPGGFKPKVELSYSSTATDGNPGTRMKQQSSWVGKGWSLDTGYVALNKLATDRGRSRYYSLVFDGQSFDLVRGNPLPGHRGNTVNPHEDPPDPLIPSHWEWNPTNESFIRARAVYIGPSDNSRGGFHGNNTPYERYIWQVWAKNGTRYDFNEDMWQGFRDCDNYNAFMETYKWYLYRVVDTNHNVITYNYDRTNQTAYQFEAVNAGCEGVRGTADYSIRPTSITWGHNSQFSYTDSPDRYMVVFTSTVRTTIQPTIDNELDYPDNQLGQPPQEKWRLNQIGVFSKQANNWELIRQYNLSYATGSTDDPFIYTDYPEDGLYVYHPKMTLTGITMFDSDANASLPPLTFGYGRTRGTDPTFPNGDWNRLITVDNHHGGTITFTYQNIGAYTGDHTFKSNRRVTSKIVTDGQGHTYTWTYDYSTGTPSYNTLGTIPNSNNVLPNSAALYYNRYYYGVSNIDKLVHKGEFRGHSYVVETDPNGKATQHYFYQGDAYRLDTGSCTYPGDPNPLGGNALLSNACFLTMRKQEFLKGKEYKTITHDGGVSAAKLSETDHTFAVNFLSYGWDAWANDSLSGLWRAFSYESSTKQIIWDKDSNNNDISLIKTTNYTYDIDDPIHYGNLKQVDELDNSNSLYRRTEHTYGTRIDGYSYIVDRVLEDNIKVYYPGDGSYRWLAKTVYGYDGSYGGGNPGIPGNLTLVRKYYDIPIQNPQSNLPTTIHSSDTSYVYDLYGNQSTVTTYEHEGSLTTTTGVYGPPGGVNGATQGRTAITYYDTTFHAFPVQYGPPRNERGVILWECADYDYRIGTLTSVTDANGQATTAAYDKFGRMIRLVKPGDSDTLPTMSAIYTDTVQPFAYMVKKRESTSANAIRTIIQFYDGMGRQIQTKSESGTNPTDNQTQNIVVDKVYDGMGNVTQQSQPRYVDQSDASFYQYLTPPTSGINWTTTTYDGLGRPRTVTAPDNTATTNEFKILDGRNTVASIDAKGHKTRQDSDEFGRLREVKEYTGTSPNWGSTPATSSYSYNPLDLLTGVTDAGNPSTHSTSIQYDSLGRKASMDDMTMGHWDYGYDVNGNIITQTDNQSSRQTIAFSYDKLDRLIRKTYGNPSANNYSYYVYDEPWTTYGLGHLSYAGRRENNVITSVVSKDYTTRGQESRVVYSVLGLPGSRIFQFTYDSADRLTTMAYPSNQTVGSETVTYTYDAAWRQKSACSDISGQNCYVSSASYSALDQPQSVSLGNSLTQSYTYASPMQRLSRLQAGTLFDRSYQYDNVGNVSSITNNLNSENQTLLYDERDRLTNWTVSGGGPNETYAFDTIGNITSKAGVTYNYGTGNGGPHAVHSTSSGNSYTYDGNGNMMTGAGRTYTWNVENQPSQIAVSGGATETYGYDADGTRVKRTVTQGSNQGTTYYIGGMYEEEYPQGSNTSKTRNIYTLNGQVVAQNEWVSDAATPTNTPVSTSTNTPTNTPTPSYTATYTPTPTSTPTDTPTAVACSVIDLPHYLHAADRPDVNNGYLMDHGQPRTGWVAVTSANSVQWSSPAFSNVTFAGGDYALHVRVNPCPPSSGLGPRTGSGPGPGSGSGSGSAQVGPGSKNRDANSPARVDSNLSVEYKLEDVTINGLTATLIGTPVAVTYTDTCQAVNDTVTFVTGRAALPLAANHRLRLTITMQTTNYIAQIYIGDTYLSTPPYTVEPCPTSTPTATSTPVGAYHYFAPETLDGTPGPQNGGTVLVGQKFILDLMVDAAQYTVNSQQAYLRFNNTLLQNVNATQSGCVITNTVTQDTTYFEVGLNQNQVCNGPNNCRFGNLTANPGDMAFASGTLGNSSCGAGCTGQFRVAKVAFCAINSGETLLHWQFSPFDPVTRDTQIIQDSGSVNQTNVAYAGNYVDYWLNIVGEMPTETPTPLTPIPTNTPTITYTPTNTRTITNTPTATPTATAILVGHVTWQGIPQPSNTPDPRNIMGITLTLKLGTSNEYNYTGLTTDASGFFTVAVDSLAAGTYNWRAKGSRSLASSGTVSLPGSGGGTTQQEMGQQKAGDAVTSPASQWNIVNTSDFNALKNQFGQSGTNLSADFDNNGVVNASDFNLLKQNFGQAGSGPIRPIMPIGGGDSSETGDQGKAVAMAVTLTATPQRTTLNAQSRPYGPNGPSNPTSPQVTRTLVYFHTDHLGSVGLVSSSSGTQVSSQEFDPWGKVRSGLGNVSETKRNYTGQKLDDTGLLFYNARYYDPSLARFVSADSIVPGGASGCGCGASTLGEGQNTKLTVDFHESAYLSSAKSENLDILREGFWFQLSGSGSAGTDISGPYQPQALNRYSYVLNNPVRYVDPTGHKVDSGSGGSGPKLAHVSDSNARKWAQRQQGYRRPHDFLDEVKGGRGSRGELYYDQDTGEVYVCDHQGDYCQRTGETLPPDLRGKPAEVPDEQGADDKEQNQQNASQSGEVIPWLLAAAAAAASAVGKASRYAGSGGAAIPGGACMVGVNCSMLR